MRCSGCGYEAPQASGFCPNCGKRMEAQQEPKNIRCHKCNSVVPGNSGFCPYCGTRLGEAERVYVRCDFCNNTYHVTGDGTCPYCGKRPGENKPEQKNKKPLLIGAVVAVVVSLLAVFMSSGSGGGSDCDRVGHSWNRATYYTPQTCSVCGITEGQSLARVMTDSELSCSWSDDMEYVKCGSYRDDEWVKIFSQKVVDCVAFNLTLEATANSGNIDCEWEILVKNGGSWSSAKKFNYSGSSKTIDVEFNSPQSFDQICLICHASDVNYDYAFWLNSGWVLR